MGRQRVDVRPLVDTLYPILLGPVNRRHTWPVPTTRSANASPGRRRSPGRPPLPREDIVGAALAILDEEGPEALSLRGLAQRMGSGTATLYRHFDSRADLLDEVADRILAEILVEPAAVAAASWQESIEALATAMFGVLRKHRNAAPLLARRIPLGPNAMIQRERALALLLAAGFSPALAVSAYTTIARHVLGFALQLTDGTSAEQQDEATAISAYVEAADPERFPATVAVAAAMPVPLEEEFVTGLRLIITGLEVAREDEARS